jgi:histone H2B
MAKTASQKKIAKKAVSTRKPKRSFSIYATRTLKALEPKATMASKTKKIINSFVNDIFDRLATQAAALARVNKKQTLGSREMQTAVRLVLPADLAKHAMSEGTKAVGKMN